MQLEHAGGDLVVELEAGALGLVGDRAAARQLGHEQVAAVADERRVDVLERRRVGADAGGVQPGLVREGVLADVRLRGVGLAVEQLVGEVRRLGQQRSCSSVTTRRPILSWRLAMIVMRFALPVRSPMPFIVPCTCVAPRLDGHQAVGDRAAAVVVAVDPELHAGQRGRDVGDRGQDLVSTRRPSRSAGPTSIRSRPG